MIQNEITTKDVLLNPVGELTKKGFSKSPMLQYNPENIRVFPLAALNRLRLKEWDYYGITTKDFFFSATISNEGYIGLVFAYFIDFRTNEMAENMVITPFGKGCRLPLSSETGDAVFQKRGIKISFIRETDRRIVKVSWKNFFRKKDIAADLVIQQPKEHESIVMATPIGQKHFYYNHKINCMPTEGWISYGDAKYYLSGKNSLATLDWGRGAWEYSTFWNWASASGFLADGRTVGLNLGKGFGDLRYSTENCFYINGKMTKLGWVDIEYDPQNFMRPWKFTSDDRRLYLIFTPFFERTSKTNLLLLKAESHQMFGKYNGIAVANSGETITISELIGWAEEHQAKW